MPERIHLIVIDYELVSALLFALLKHLLGLKERDGGVGRGKKGEEEWARRQERNEEMKGRR